MSKKEEIIRLRVTNDEKQKIASKAKLCGLSTSEFIRRMVLEKAPTFLSIEDRDELADLKTKLIQLIRIGNLYHEQRKQNQSIIGQVKSFLKRIK